MSGKLVDSFGVRYVVPGVQEWPGTIAAVNVGGTLVPVILSIYLLGMNRLYFRGFMAVGAVALVTHLAAQPV